MSARLLLYSRLFSFLVCTYSLCRMVPIQKHQLSALPCSENHPAMRPISSAEDQADVLEDRFHR